MLHGMGIGANKIWGHWLLAVCAAALLIAGVPYTRPMCDALRAHGALRPVLNTFALVLITGFCWVWIRIYKTVSWRRVAILGVVLAVYGWAWLAWTVAPEERFHFASIALLAFLWHRALRSDGRSLNVRTWGAGLLAALVGVLEEVAQIWVPDRVFDGSDIGKCVFSAALAALALRFVIDSDKK